MSLNVFWSRLLRWDGSLHQTIRLLALGVPFPIIAIDEGVLFNWRVIQRPQLIKLGGFRFYWWLRGSLSPISP